MSEELETIVRKFAKLNGAMELWRSWSTNMLSQGREVAKERLSWDTLPERDKELDARISAEVIMDFLVWANSHCISEIIPPEIMRVLEALEKYCDPDRTKMSYGELEYFFRKYQDWKAKWK